jgi:hypothetical protein
LEYEVTNLETYTTLKCDITVLLPLFSEIFQPSANYSNCHEKQSMLLPSWTASEIDKLRHKDVRNKTCPMQVFWVVMPDSTEWSLWHVIGTYCIHLQDRREGSVLHLIKNMLHFFYWPYPSTCDSQLICM